MKTFWPPSGAGCVFQTVKSVGRIFSMSRWLSVGKSLEIVDNKIFPSGFSATKTQTKVM